MIGLDIGTHAVRAVEVSVGRGLPVVERMGQIGLPPGAVVAGEVVDPPAVSEALRRLWKDVAFSSREVVVGVANARVVARMTEMPALPEDELRSSLPFQVQELIPIPVSEAQLDFQVTDRFVNDAGEERVKLMLVAAQRDMLRSLLAAVDGAGLVPTRLDLVALALIRALFNPADWMLDDAPSGRRRSEVIIGAGAGVTNVVVHDEGVPSFVRTVASGGGAVTEAVALELGIGSEEAEGLKRAAGGNVIETTSAAIQPVVGEVVGSLDFHRASESTEQVGRVILSGGGSRLTALQTSLADQLNVPVEIGNPYRNVRMGKVGIDSATVNASGDLFAVAIGLALSGVALDGDRRRISLLPDDVAAEREAHRQLVLAGAGIGAFAVLLIGAAFVRGMQVDDARGDARRAEAATVQVETEIAKYRDVEQLEATIADRRDAVVAALTGDVAWPEMIEDVSAALPADVALTSWSATAGTDGAPGQLTVAAVGADHTSVARFLVAMDQLPQLDTVWLSSASRDPKGGPVTFNATAVLTPEAGSDRAETLGGAA